MLKSCFDGYLTPACKDCQYWSDEDKPGLGIGCNAPMPIIECLRAAMQRSNEDEEKERAEEEQKTLLKQIFDTLKEKEKELTEKVLIQEREMTEKVYKSISQCGRVSDEVMEISKSIDDGLNKIKQTEFLLRFMADVLSELPADEIVERFEQNIYTGEWESVWLK